MRFRYKALVFFALAATVLLTFLSIGGHDVSGKAVSKPKAAGMLKHDISIPLRDIVPTAPLPRSAAKVKEMPRRASPGASKSMEAGSASQEADPLVQYTTNEALIPDPFANFEGTGNVNNTIPPDTNGDVGPNHYVQWVNSSFAVYDKQGTLMYGPAAGNTLWTGWDSVCAQRNDGEGTVLYDQLADRWFMSQVAYPNYPEGPFYQCFAISETSDPMGRWYLYEGNFDYLTGHTVLNHYPKFGIWPDGYYMAMDQYQPGTMKWAGTGVMVFQRSKMLLGEDAWVLYFDLGSINPRYRAVLPADFDGIQPPKENGAWFAELDDNGTASGFGRDSVLLWQCKVDWIDPSKSVFGVPGTPYTPNSVLEVESFNPLCPENLYCVPQPDSAPRLDAIGDRLMVRLQYRKFADRESMVVNHTVDAGNGRAGIRWYEIRVASQGYPFLYQQGTYAPDDGIHRWMGSMAMDGSGNIGLGYSASSETVYPSIRYTGRLATDEPLGVMTQGEGMFVAGGGAQTYPTGRWGDYSMMSVDPVDDCTFWYTQEYYPTTSLAGWHTRIGSFKFDQCLGDPQAGGVIGVVKNAETGLPIFEATVQAGSTWSTTGADGRYSLLYLPIGDYELSASAFEYLPEKVALTVYPNTVSRQDISLTHRPPIKVCGKVTDGSGQGWGLYAKVDIIADGEHLDPIFTDPDTGEYCVTLWEGAEYTFTVTALVRGYESVTFTGIPDPTEDFALKADKEDCSTPGYGQVPLYAEDFELGDGGYVASDGYRPWQYSGGNAYWYTPRVCDYGETGNVTLTSPKIDLSTAAGQPVTVSWWEYIYEFSDDPGVVEVSSDDGLSWTTIHQVLFTYDDWRRVSVPLDASYATAAFRIRFSVYRSSYYYDCTGGYYITDIEVTTCALRQGALVIGQVYDENIRKPLDHAYIVDWRGLTTSTGTQPGDEALSGFYSFFLPFGANVLTTYHDGYDSVSQNLTIPTHGTLRVDFSLPTPLLLPDTTRVEVSVGFGGRTSAGFTLNNTGGAYATYGLYILPPSQVPSGPFQKPAKKVERALQGSHSAERAAATTALPEAAVIGGGGVVESWRINSQRLAWGVAFDPRSQTVWVSDFVPSDSDAVGQMVEYYPDTFYTHNLEPTGNTQEFSWQPPMGPADMAYNWNTGNFWVVTVDPLTPGNCIFEMNPDHGFTGKKVCPGGTGFEDVQYGLAYDPTTDSFFAGGWSDGMIHHFDSNGVLLDEVDVNLPIAGLAYNPTTKHLFVMTNYSPNPIFVLDASSQYAVVGLFYAGFGAYQGAGLEIDCDGYLWAIQLDYNDEDFDYLYKIDSGETTDLCKSIDDLSWVGVWPRAGSIGPDQSQYVEMGFSADNPKVTGPGQYRAVLKAANNTVYPVPEVQVLMNVLNALKVTIVPEEAIYDGGAWRVDGGEWLESGFALTGLAAGEHLVEFRETENGWLVPPDPQTVTIKENESQALTGEYKLAYGAVTVTITPPEAVRDGGMWTMDYWEWHQSGETIEDVRPGIHEVLLKPIAGWTSPFFTLLTVEKDKTTSVTLAYTKPSGSLQVFIKPSDVSDVGAQWQVDGGDWKDGTETVSGLSVGEHTVSFSAVTGWTSPDSIKVTVKDGETTRAYGKYTLQTGTLTVTLEPKVAADAGARWRVEGGRFKKSGESITLPLGEYAVEFNTVAGWNPPAEQTATITNNETTTLTGTYTVQSGALFVFITPAEAVDAGAKWKLDLEETWRSAGTLVEGLSVGKHTVKFKSVSGWTKPADQTLTVVNNGTSAAVGDYALETGAVKVTITPEEACEAGAQWRLGSEDDWHDSGARISGIPVGDHTIEFRSISGWEAPANKTVTVAKGKTTTVSEKYTQLTGNIKVIINPTSANSAGAMWRLDLGKWQKSNATLKNIPIGSHVVNFKGIKGWVKPEDVAVEIAKSQTLNVKETYTK